MPLASATSHHVATIGAVVGGLGVALAAAAVGHYLWNRGRYEDWKAALRDTSAANRRQQLIDENELAASIERASRVTVGLALGSGALLATGTTLIVIDAGTSKRDPSSGLNVSLTGVW